MQALVLVTLLIVTTAEYFVSDLKVLPSIAKLLPELMSVLVAAYVLAAGLSQRFQYVSAKYWILFGSIAFIMLCGILANGVEPGPMINGMRMYLRAIPFFLLPAVYMFSDKQIRQQLLLLLAISLIQLPMAVWQRLGLMAERRWSGDYVYGTLMISSTMSMFLISVSCILLGLYLTKRIKAFHLGALFLILLFPTTINETKGTLILLPIALYTALILGSPRHQRVRVTAGATALLIAFIAIYVPVYNYLSNLNNPYPTTISEYLLSEKRLKGYLQKDTSVGSRQEVGRVDALVEPIKYNSRDPVALFFGVGMGNASDSSLGPQFSGRYDSILGRFVKTTSAGAFGTEIGVVGLALALLVIVFFFLDARIVAIHDYGLMRALAIGWTGVCVLIFVAVFYKAIHGFESLTYLFWYFSGLIAARRTQLLPTGFRSPMHRPNRKTIAGSPAPRPAGDSEARLARS